MFLFTRHLFPHITQHSFSYQTTCSTFRYLLSFPRNWEVWPFLRFLITFPFLANPRTLSPNHLPIIPPLPKSNSLSQSWTVSPWGLPMQEAEKHSMTPRLKLKRPVLSCLSIASFMEDILKFVSFCSLTGACGWEGPVRPVRQDKSPLLLRRVRIKDGRIKVQCRQHVISHTVGEGRRSYHHVALKCGISGCWTVEGQAITCLDPSDEATRYGAVAFGGTIEKATWYVQNVAAKGRVTHRRCMWVGQWCGKRHPEKEAQRATGQCPGIRRVNPAMQIGWCLYSKYPAGQSNITQYCCVSLPK